MSEPIKPPERPRKRGRYRFSLGVLMLFVLIVGGGLGWITHGPRVQQEAVAAIQAAGGRVEYDWDAIVRTDMMAPPPTGKVAGPAWVVKWLGIDYVGTVRNVYLGGPKADDALMEHVGRLDGLRELHFSNMSPVTDAGFAKLSRLRQVKYLEIGNTKLTGAAIAHFAKMSDLRYLNLPGVKIVDADLAPMAGLTELRWFQASDPRITDAGVKHLAGLSKLELLSLVNTRVTENGMAVCKRMPNLQTVNLNKTKVANLDFLTGLAKLDQLSLGETPIDDRATGALESLPALTMIDLDKTRVGDDTVARLKSPKLFRVGLDDTLVSDAGLSHLANRMYLHQLKLSGTSVSDAGLLKLGKLPSLDSLGLERTKVSDAMLPTLASFPGCKWVSVKGTKVTSAGIQAAKALFPGMSIQ